jgi:hypothetical protein
LFAAQDAMSAPLPASDDAALIGRVRRDLMHLDARRNVLRGLLLSEIPKQEEEVWMMTPVGVYVRVSRSCAAAQCSELCDEHIARIASLRRTLHNLETRFSLRARTDQLVASARAGGGGPDAVLARVRELLTSAEDEAARLGIDL